MINFHVENGAGALARTRDGETVLYSVLAAFGEHDALETAKPLVAHGCDPLQANSRGETPLYIAVERGHFSVVCYLLSLGVPLPFDLFITWSRGSTQDRTRLIRFLVENGLDVFSHAGSGDSLLHIVMDSFHEDDILATTKLLFALGCDPLQVNSRGETPIHNAIGHGLILLVRYLLSLGVPLPCDALFIALHSPRFSDMNVLGKSEMVDFLIDQGANVLTRQSNGDSVLHAAIIAFPDGDPDILEDVITSLVACGCDLAISNIHGVAPLHVAVKHGGARAMIVKHFISLNAPLPPDILFTAIESDSVSSSPQVMDVIKVLVTSGCDTLTRNEAGYTPLHAAVIKGYVTVVDYLLAVMDNPPSEDLLEAAELAPPDIRSEMISMLKSRFARSESPDWPDLRPAKRTKYSQL